MRMGLCVALASLCLAGFAMPSSAQNLKRGEYLASIMDCGGCHTPGALAGQPDFKRSFAGSRSEEHTSELQSLMRSSYAVFCLKKKKKTRNKTKNTQENTI